PDEGIHAVVRETNRPLRLTQDALAAHPRWEGPSADGQQAPMRGWLGVPLTNRRGENIGVLQLTDKYEGEFSLQDEYVAVELAQLASIALENVVLFEEVRALNSGLEQKVHDRTRELIREQARYRALTDQAPQIIWSYESGKGVTYFNRTWYELVGGTPDYWQGSNRWADVIHPDDRDAALANWALARQTRTVYKGERRIRDKYGRYHIMSYRGAPVYDESGRVMCWVGIDTDITESKLVESQLRESNRELEAFSYSVSHDLRSPLNTIHGFSKLLAREVPATEGSRVPHYLDRIQAATGYMGQLIEDLLSLAQVSRANLRNEPVDLSEVARGILERLQQTEPQRDVQVRVQDGLIGWGDVRLLRVMLENLLGNAWKFTSQTPNARIEVGVEAADGEDGVFFVRDNGAGFDMAYADKLFGVFHRLHAAVEFPGTGIGLATVHRIVTRHLGRVWAEARPGEGATFR
ncbi:MAG: PAS domain S-box protein, partial [Lysobacteraceae bacterium]